MINKLIMKLLLFVIIAVLNVSCFESNNKLEDRVIERWHSVIDSDYSKAYLYETPSYRKINSLDAFSNIFGSDVEWKAVELGDVEYLNENLADVNLILHYVYNQGMLLPSHIKERWFFEDGQWWHITK